MSGLDERDMHVLREYAQSGNRERYWNYLAQHEGADGYGLLALGVVRNDNMPGAVANAYAQYYARQHNGVELSERGWEMFGRDLISEDFARRREHFKQGERLEALNLPAKDVQDAHKAAFNANHIGADAWTPNRLMDAARRTGGEPEVNKVWHSMLDNELKGLTRMGSTSWAIAGDYRENLPGWKGYMTDLAAAEFGAVRAAPITDPDHIQRGIDHFEFDRERRTWTVYSDSDVVEFGFRTPAETVRDHALIDSLNDARATRLEREALSKDVHPDDPYRAISPSPHTIADATSARPNDIIAVTGRSISPGLYDELRQRLPENTSEERLAQVTLAVQQADMRAGEISGMSIHNNTTLQIVGAQPGDRAIVDLSTPPPAVDQSIMQSHVFNEAQAADTQKFVQQQSSVEQAAQLQVQQQEQFVNQAGPSMGGPRMG